jgi:hypothetical protein
MGISKSRSGRISQKLSQLKTTTVQATGGLNGTAIVFNQSVTNTFVIEPNTFCFGLYRVLLNVTMNPAAVKAGNPHLGLITGIVRDCYAPCPNYGTM